jgi:enamine deaminase RidA (YjgF/YER057c/UK114 family)
MASPQIAILGSIHHMARLRFSSGSRIEEEIGYSRAVIDGDWIFVSGTTGYDDATMTIAPGVVEQCEQTFLNIEAALRQAGGRIDDIVRDNFILPDRADWPACRTRRDLASGCLAVHDRHHDEHAGRSNRAERAGL